MNNVKHDAKHQKFVFSFSWKEKISFGWENLIEYLFNKYLLLFRVLNNRTPLFFSHAKEKKQGTRRSQLLRKVNIRFYRSSVFLFKRWKRNHSSCLISSSLLSSFPSWLTFSISFFSQLLLYKWWRRISLLIGNPRASLNLATASLGSTPHSWIRYRQIK